MKNFYKGYFAFGLIVGVGFAVFVHFSFISPCSPENSILWFCNERPEIVLRVLGLIEAIVTVAIWPAALILLVLYLRQEISALLLRVSKVGTDGVKFHRASNQQDLSENVQATNLPSSTLEQLSDEVAAEVERRLKSDLESVSDENKIPILLRALTIERMNKTFAVAYSNIFGSQIRALESLNEKEIPKTEAEKKFKELQKNDPVFAEWDLERYANYLISWKFVKYSDDLYSITSTGRDFLLFLTSNGLSKERLH